MSKSLLLGVNVDHVATIRQARNTSFPDPVEVARMALNAGADFITVHVREDRRHIQESDLARLSAIKGVRVNLEMAMTDEMFNMALKYKPSDVCLVPEKREELTTEGGLNAVQYADRIQNFCQVFTEEGIRTSLFIEADQVQIEMASTVGAPVIELHTGTYADLSGNAQQSELAHIRQGVAKAAALGLAVNAGHGLNYENVKPIASIPGLTELNIGHAIVARALMVGFAEAVAEMRALMSEA